jgi:SH3-like domain-containing protein
MRRVLSECYMYAPSPLLKVTVSEHKVGVVQNTRAWRRCDMDEDKEESAWVDQHFVDDAARPSMPVVEE